MPRIHDRLHDRYSLIRSLGRGGIAEVYLAQDELIGERVALKILYPHLARQNIVLEHFKRELVITQSIAHPGVIRIFNLVEDDKTETVFLVMEYLPGGDLKTLIVDQGSLDIDRAILITKETLSALGAAHNLGITHRDIKPHNILFDKKGKVKITDFGLARCSALMGIVTSTHIMGTPEYLAPESVQSQYVDSRADLYAAGIVLYEAVTGRLPFVSNSPYRTIRLQTEGSPVPPCRINPNIPEQLEPVILKAIEKDPGSRFQTAEEFIDALGTTHLQQEPVLQETHPYPQYRGDLMLLSSPRSRESGRREVRTETGEELSYRVVVTGPGKPAEKFNHDLRYKCLRILQNANVNTERLSKHLPRLPFVLLKGVDRESADRLVKKLGDSGIESAALSKQDRERKKQVELSIFRKVLSMTPRFYAIILGSSVAVISGTGRFPIVLGIFGMMLLGVPVFLSIRYHSPEVFLKKTGYGRLIMNLITIASETSNASLRTIANRILSKADVLLRRAGKESNLPADLKSEISIGVESLAQQAAEWISEAQEVDDRLKSVNETTLYIEAEELEEKLIAAENTRQADKLIREKADLFTAIDERRLQEQKREWLFDKLLSLSSRLDAFVVRLASIKAQSAKEIAVRLREIGEDLNIMASSVEEVD